MPRQKDKSGEQKDAEAEVESFKEDLGPFVVAAETTRMAMVFTDAKAKGNPIIFANDAFLALCGYSREEILAQSFNFLMAQGADPGKVTEIEDAFDGKSDFDPEIRYRRRDGSFFWASILINPVRDADGAITQHFASFVDLTKHVRERDRLRFLLDELNHRTQNTLATVLSIVGQTLHDMVDEEAIDTLEGRILALSKAHSLLGAENWDRVGLRDVIDAILEPFGLSDRRAIRFRIEGDNVRLQPKAALSLAVALHELATNATRHGALTDGASGKVAISWLVEPAQEGQRLALRWRESGGPTVSRPSHKGFGSRLIERGLAQEINGNVRLDYEPAGVVCHIDMPIVAREWANDA